MAETRTPTAASLFFGPDAPDESDLYKCVHCGFCLQVCPTYLETGLEAESPRGRIALMKAVNEGRIGITPSVVRHWDLCIQCRACEVACPSGVPYGRLIEATMQQVETRRRQGLVRRLLTGLSLKQLLPHQGRLSFLFSGLRLYQKSGVQAAIQKSGVLRLLSPKLAELESSLPVLPSNVFEAM
ncbi:MAG: 4Fe-4S dicluster domain-containing protein, partial [Chloroflexi bacterium]|nr:4Fe-4S dicluster domain-containing protein [Chloroflexota bacterium]